MFDHKGALSAGRHLEQRVILVMIHELLQHVLVVGTRKVALVVQQTEQAVRSTFDQPQTGDVVVEIDAGPINVLTLVFLLLVLKDVLIKVMVQFFVHHIDVELFKMVLVAEIFESKYICLEETKIRATAAS